MQSLHWYSVGVVEIKTHRPLITLHATGTPLQLFQEIKKNIQQFTHGESATVASLLAACVGTS